MRAVAASIDGDIEGWTQLLSSNTFRVCTRVGTAPGALATPTLARNEGGSAHLIARAHFSAVPKSQDRLTPSRNSHR
jgi:hypothetical protein